VTARSGSHSCSGWSEPDWGSRRQPRTSETANRCALSRRVVAALLGAWYAFAAVFLLAGIWVMRTVATDIGATQEIYDYMNAVEDEAGSGGTQHDADVLRAAYVASRENGRVSHTLTLANGTDILDASDDEWQRSRRRFELERNSGPRFCVTVPEPSGADYEYDRGGC